MKVATVGWVLLVAVIGLLFSGSSVRSQTNQDHWKTVGTWKHESAIYSVYYSPSRTVRRNGLVRAWFKATYPEASNTSYVFALMQFN